MHHHLLLIGLEQMILVVMFLYVYGKVHVFHLFIGITAAVIDLIIGVLWGSISGLAGGRVDNIMMRIADVLTAVPYLLVVIILLVVLQPGLLPMIIALSITGWVNMARIVRGEVLSIKNQEYVLAARTLRCKYMAFNYETFSSKCIRCNFSNDDINNSICYFHRIIFKLFRSRCSCSNGKLGNNGI